MALGWQGIVVITFTALSLLIMGFDLVGPDIVFTILLAFFCAFDGKIIPVATAGQQYGNTGLLTVIFLYWVAEGVSQTGGLEAVMTFVLGRSRSPFWALVRMMIPTMLLSAFLNNTPVVALMIPILLAWSKRCGVPSKKLLIPLSFAAVLGGTCTLIGTSTNLVVQSLATQAYIKSPKKDEAVFKIFDIAPVGIPYAIWGFLFVIFTQRWLLPGNSSRYAKDLLVAMRVVPGSPVRRKTLIESGLRSVPSVSLVGVYHKNAFYSSPAADYLLEEGDIVYFAGELDNIEFVGEEFGLGFVTSETEEGGDVVPELAEQTFEANRAGPYGKLVQVTVSPESPLLGLSIHEADFTGRFNASVIAIKRSRNRPDGRIREAVLNVGDTLVLDTLPGFDSADPDLQAAFTKIVYVKDSTAKEFVVGLKVKRGVIDEAASTALRKDVNLAGGIIGKTVTAAGLRGIPGLYVLAIDRADGTHIENISFTDVIQPDDTIWFAADLASIGFLSRFPGLELVQQQQVEKSGVNILNRTLIQAAVALKGPLVGKTVRDVRFRTKYNAAVVAVHRNGVRMPLRVQDIVLQDGDVLLLSASAEWVINNRHDRAFVMLSEVPNSNPPKKSKMVIAVLLAVGMITTQIVGGIQSREYIHLWPCAVLTAGLMLATGCMSADNARKAILWDVYLTIAAAFGVSASMERTGVAREFANVFVDLSRKLGGGNAALLCIYIATALLSEILTNNAAGAIMYPIARILGDELNTGVRAMSYAVMLGASAGFTNPFSYQCNLMVYSAGNYRTVEFVRIGVPFQIYQTVAAGFILAYRNQWHEMWIVSFIVAGAAIGIPALYSFIPDRYTIPIDMWFESKLNAVGRVLAPLAFWRKIKLPKIKRGRSFWSKKSENGNYLTGSSPAPPLVVPVKAAGTGASTPVAAKDETSSNSSRE